MTPTQVEGLWVCFSFSMAMIVLTPVLLWVFTHRQQTV